MYLRDQRVKDSQFINDPDCAILTLGEGLPAGEMLGRVDYIGIWDLTSVLLFLKSLLPKWQLFMLKNLIRRANCRTTWLGAASATWEELWNIKKGSRLEVLETLCLGVVGDWQKLSHSMNVPSLEKHIELFKMWGWWSMRGIVHTRACLSSWLPFSKWKIFF